MTDEEKTEKYLNCKTCCGRYDRIKKSCIYTEKCELYNIYLAGLAEGKTKWHDLRKNPDDLPQNKSDVIIFRGYYTFGFYETDEKVWLEFEYSNVYKDAENVIAWTDIPKFEVEK